MTLALVGAQPGPSFDSQPVFVPPPGQLVEHCLGTIQAPDALLRSTRINSGSVLQSRAFRLRGP